MPRWLPLPPLRRYPKGALGPDLLAAFTVLFLGVPQGLAYATIAGLPPVVGLYAATIPAIIGSLFRSSPLVIAGPTNALSLLVGAGIANEMGTDPVATALTLALLVGALQAAAGLLRLGALVDFISTAVVLGYITGAGVLIGFGQLHNATGTSGPSGRIWVTVRGWLDHLGDASGLAIAVTLTTIGVLVATRWFERRTGKRIPGAIVAMSLGLVANLVFGLERHGLAVVSDLAPIPSGFPPLTLPDVSLAPGLFPLAIACAVLSLVESSTVATSAASRTGTRLDASTEFFGQGLANLAAAFFGGYPISGSLGRSALNERTGARTRLSGVLGGLMMLAVLATLGPLLNHTPVASLAGLMFVVAYDLIDLQRIRAAVRSSHEDAAAFFATMLGTWAFSLDIAIYVGVGISLVLFLRRARLIRVTELVPDGMRLSEAPEHAGGPANPVRLLQVEGSVFFGAAGELREALGRVLHDPATKVLVVRLKRASGLDATTAAMLAELAEFSRAQGQHIVLAGVTARAYEVLERSGALQRLDPKNVFQTRSQWFRALAAGLERAAELSPQAERAFGTFLENAKRQDPTDSGDAEDQDLDSGRPQN
ncbi:MAG: SulP family inorganic anion transporter [Nannocystaceae bacterium]|nr:SulP family inorganic anion transporter [Nannocystaceae bacterium]